MISYYVTSCTEPRSVRRFTRFTPSFEGSLQGCVPGPLMSPRHAVFLILLAQTSAFLKNAAKSRVCHRSTKSARKPFACHTSKIAVCKSFVCHTSEPHPPVP